MDFTNARKARKKQKMKMERSSGVLTDFYIVMMGLLSKSLMEPGSGFVMESSTVMMAPPWSIKMELKNGG
jgi:hypothetical protein